MIKVRIIWLTFILDTDYSHRFQWTVQCVHVLNKTYQICFDFLPVTKYTQLMPKLKQAIDGLKTVQKSIKPKIILRALELTNPARDANEIVHRQHITPNPLNPPDMVRTIYIEYIQ